MPHPVYCTFCSNYYDFRDGHECEQRGSMTLEEAQEFLYFMRDEMLKNYSYDAELVWKMPEVVLNNPTTAKLTGRWFHATKPDMRKYLETRILEDVKKYDSSRN